MQVGKKVVCVDDVFPAWVYDVYKELPVKDVTYTVREVRLGRTQWGVMKDGKLVKNGASETSATVALLVEELHNPDDPWGPTNNKGGVELGFNSERFRELEEAHDEDELSDAMIAAVADEGFRILEADEKS
jgi:hypothetical protein